MTMWGGHQTEETEELGHFCFSSVMARQTPSSVLSLGTRPPLTSPTSQEPQRVPSNIVFLFWMVVFSNVRLVNSPTLLSLVLSEMPSSRNQA